MKALFLSARARSHHHARKEHQLWVLVCIPLGKRERLVWRTRRHGVSAGWYVGRNVYKDKEKMKGNVFIIHSCITFSLPGNWGRNTCAFQARLRVPGVTCTWVTAESCAWVPVNKKSVTPRRWFSSRRQFTPRNQEMIDHPHATNTTKQKR